MFLQGVLVALPVCRVRRHLTSPWLQTSLIEFWKQVAFFGLFQRFHLITTVGYAHPEVKMLEISIKLLRSHNVQEHRQSFYVVLNAYWQ